MVRIPSIIDRIPHWALDFTAGIGVGSMFHDLFDDFVFRIDPSPWHVFSGKFIGATILTVSFVLLRIGKRLRKRLRNLHI